MPKKTASARGGASRNKPKSQKNVQLVRPVSAESDGQDEGREEEATVSSTSAATAGTTATATKSEVTAATKAEAGTLSAPMEKEKEQDVPETSAAGKGSAAARLAARRQQAQKQQAQRNVNLITSEHYAYVRRDLVYIAILASIFFATLIVLHFVPAIGG